MAVSMSRAVLASDVSRDDIDDAMARCELHLTNVVPKYDDIPAQLIYSADAASHLYVIEETRLGVIYLAAVGPDAAALMKRVVAELPCIGDEDVALLDGLLSAGAADLEAITVRLAACALCSPNTPPTVARLDRALRHTDRAVRNVALLCTTYAPTRALYAALAGMRDADVDLELRAQAGRVLECVLREQP